MAGNVTIDIKSVSGETVLSVPLNEGAKGSWRLMEHDYVTLPFKLREPVEFPLGSWCDLSGVIDEAAGTFAKIYEVCSPYAPEYDGKQYSYSLRLDAYYIKWKNKIFRYMPENAAGEASWSLTAPLAVHLGVVLRNLEALGYRYRNVPFDFDIDKGTGEDAKALTYDNSSVLDALYAMAEAWECDFWVEDSVIRFGRLERGDAVRLETDKEMSSMSFAQSSGAYATRIYAFGGDRNIPPTYRKKLEFTVTSAGGGRMKDAARQLLRKHFPEDAFDEELHSSGRYFKYIAFDKDYPTDSLPPIQLPLEAGKYRIDLYEAKFVAMDRVPLVYFQAALEADGGRTEIDDFRAVYVDEGTVMRPFGADRYVVSSGSSQTAKMLFTVTVEQFYDYPPYIEIKEDIEVRALSLNRARFSVTFISGSLAGQTFEASAVASGAGSDAPFGDIEIPGASPSPGDKFTISGLDLKEVPSSWYTPVAGEDDTVQGIVQSRLMLPEGTPYIDVYPDMAQEEAVEQAVVFEDVYPKRTGTLSGVHAVQIDEEDGDGNPTGNKVDIYRYKDTGLNFDDRYLIDGQELRAVFQSGRMNGMEFVVIYEPESTEKGGGIWEIVRNEDYGRWLPDSLIYPEDGDEYILTGFDVSLVSDSYVPAAEQELKEKAEAYAEKLRKNDGTYTVTLRHSWVSASPLERTFSPGQLVELASPAFRDGSRTRRVLGADIYLDIPSDSPSYTVGETSAYSRLSALEAEMEGVTFLGKAYQGYASGGGSRKIYVIGTNDSTAPTDSNVLSAKRSVSMFLRKDKEDQTKFLQTFLGGIVSEFMRSPDFVSLLVRIKAAFQMLEILKTDIAGGELVLNAGARLTVTKVETLGDVPAYFADGSEAYFRDGERAYFAQSYRLHFLADDGETKVRNLFHVGDLARCQTFGIEAGAYEGVSNRFWWRLVTAVGDGWIEVSSTVCAEGSDIPKEGDTVAQWGNDRDADRQALMVLSAYGQGAPSITMYQGVDSFSLSGKGICRIGYNAAEGECEVMFGRNDGKGYFLYSPSKGLRVAGNIEVLGGSGMSNFDDAMDFAEQVNGSMAQYLGYDGWEDIVEQALRGKTLIRGGVINTSLISADDLFAGDIYAGNATITEGTFKKINVDDATITNSTLTDVNVTGTINANAGEIGGFTIRDKRLSYEYSTDGNGEGQPSIVINASGTEFFRVNESPTVGGGANGSPFLYIRADRRPAIWISTGGDYSDAHSGIKVTCNGYNGKAIESHGNVLLEARDGENVKVNGLALNVRTVSSSGEIYSSDDVIVSTAAERITLNLPRSGHNGKVIWVRKAHSGNITVSGNGLSIKENNAWGDGGWSGSVEVANGQLWMFVCTGGVWYANCLT